MLDCGGTEGSPCDSSRQRRKAHSKPGFWKVLLVRSFSHRLVKEQSLKQAFEYIQKNKEPFLRDFRTLLRQPSVSAQGKGIIDCARIVKKNMDAAGIKTQILPEKNGNPIVYGEVKSKSSSKILLIYGHYDVQPVEPLEEWDSGPFDAKLEGRKIISRGAADSKNNIISCIKATESFLKATGDVPLNLKIPFRGENYLKEWGLKKFLNARTNREALKKYLMEPTCTICGFKTGYIGQGSKTVLPGSAMLKIDFRLVYNQNPKKLLGKLKDHLHHHGFDDIHIKPLGFLEPSRTKPSAPIARAAAKAAKIAYGLGPVVLPRNPASGPDYLFTKRLGLDSIWTGSGPPSAYSHAHAPNEYTTTDDFIAGIRYITAIIHQYASIV